MITTLDDFGLSKKVNTAILRYIRKNKVDYISLLPNMEATTDALIRFKKEKTKVCKMGLHVNLVEGKPLSKKTDVPSLVMQNGWFYPLPLFILRLFFGLINKDEVMKELSLQLRILKHSGNSCSHINSHQNIHIFHLMYSYIQEFAQINKIPTIRQLSTVQSRLKNFPIKYILFHILYGISSLLFPSYRYIQTSFHEVTFHPGTRYDR